MISVAQNLCSLDLIFREYPERSARMVRDLSEERTREKEKRRKNGKI